MGPHNLVENRALRAEVIDLILDERGLPREKVHLSSRLAEDLGMDGDDAVYFFRSVQERFGTDLTHLHEGWNKRFSPEGFSCWNGLIIIPASIVGGLMAGAAGLSTFWGVAVAAALLAAWAWGMRRWRPPDRMIPVTVAEVLAAVEAGAWPRPPSK
jgi:hypothetical protein